MANTKKKGRKKEARKINFTPEANDFLDWLSARGENLSVITEDGLRKDKLFKKFKKEQDGRNI